MNNELKPCGRCKWCIARIGVESYRMPSGVWHKGLCVPLSGDFTDGICPDCFAQEKEKILAMKLQ
jgi:hypothetical protein